MTRLLIVDDSALMRRLLRDIFGDAGDFEIEVARGGEEALAKLHDFAPEVITLDVQMPDMDGLAVLDRIMVERPTPVVMVSSLTEAGADATLEAMQLGAIDFIAKPRGAISLEIDAVVAPLIEKVRAAARARVSRAARLTERVRLRSGGRAASIAQNPPRSKPGIAGDGLVLIGTSTGGPPALDAVLGALPGDFPLPILVAQHMPASFTGALARRLDRHCALEVHEVSATTTLRAGHAYIGRGDADVLVSRRGDALVALPAPASGEYHWHPSVDRMVASAMQHVAPEKLVGVLMTGMGADGAATMTELMRAGGHVIAEAAETAVVWGMPGALVAGGGASIVVPLDRIAEQLAGLPVA